MVLLHNAGTGEINVFSIKSCACPANAHRSNKNYPALAKEIKKRLETFRRRAELKLDLFTGEPAVEPEPEKPGKKKK